MGFRFFKKKTNKTTPGKVAQVLKAADIDLVLDVGANTGQTGLALRNAGYNGKIVSFEPVPSAHEALHRVACTDPLWVIAPPMAIAAQDGDMTLNVSQATDMSSALEPSADLLTALPKTLVQEQVKVPARTLDSVVPEFQGKAAHIFLKIDTQGFERQVLEGATHTLKAIKGIQMELSLFPLYKGEETYLSFLHDLHGLGFEPHMIVETTFSQKLHRQLQIDVVFMR